MSEAEAADYEDEYKCVLCGRAFETERMRNIHETWDHDDESDEEEEDTTFNDDYVVDPPIRDFPRLRVRQVTFHTYKVLHLKDDEASTVSTVNLHRSVCDCPDYNNRKDGRKTCKHLEAAYLEAPTTISAKEAFAYKMDDVLRDAHETLEDIKRYRTGLMADYEAQTSQQSAEAGQNDNGRDINDPVAAFRELMDEKGHPNDYINVWVDDQFGSLQFESNDMPEDDFQDFKSWCQSQDSINWDRDEYRNYIKSDDFEEVLG